MAPLALRTQLLIATILIVLTLTGAILLIVRHTVGTEIQKQVHDGTQESVRTFENMQQQRELQLSRAAEMLADLPPLKAMMTTGHAPTIQDGSETFFAIAQCLLRALRRANVPRDRRSARDLAAAVTEW